jgi:hypothetical protein
VQGAVDAAFASFGRAAVYVPPTVPGGPSVAVSVIAAREDMAATPGLAPLVSSGGGLFEVRVSELSGPLKGGTLTLDGVTWTIRETPSCRDPDRLVWTLRCARS